MNITRRATYINTPINTHLPIIYTDYFEVEKAKKWFNKEELHENRDYIYLLEDGEWVYDNFCRRAIELYFWEVIPMAVESGFSDEVIEKLSEEINKQQNIVVE